MITEIGTYLKGINPFFYAAAVGILVGFWSRIKGYLIRATKLIFFTVKFNTGDGEPFIPFLLSNFPIKRTIFSDITIRSPRLYFLPTKTRKDIFIYSYSNNQNSTTTLLYKKLFPVILKNAFSKDTGTFEFTITTLRFVPLWAWLKKYQDYVINKKDEKFYFEEVSGSRGEYKNGQGQPLEAKSVNADKPDEIIPVFVKRSDLEMPRSDKHLNYYVPKYMQEIYDDIKFFVSSEDWYNERLLTYKRGYLFYGLPGTGKTSFLRVIGEELNIPIYRFDLSSFGNNGFKRRWDEITSYNSLKIILFEDFHSVFKGRENITNLDGVEPGISFDCLLNCIDGVQKNSSVILAITTNDISVIDPALFSMNNSGLVSRPGRIDMAAEFQKLDLEGRLHVANVILKGFDAEIVEVSNSNEDCTAAQFEELCKQKAKVLYYQAKEKGTLPP